MQKIKQFRYKFSDNEFSNIGSELLFSKTNILNAGEEDYSSVSQIGIQGLPGTHFWLNDSWASPTVETNQGLYLNWTGIFELDLSSLNGEITSICFSNDSKKLYEDSPTTALIIDILYDNNISIGKE